MKKTWRIWLAVFVLTICLCASGLAGENMLVNPEIALLDGAALGWTADAWDPARSTLGVSADGGVDGGSCLHIRNDIENDARFCQTVEVEPNSLYRLSCWIKAENIVGGTSGANISVENAFTYSNAVFDTDGEWVLSEMYGKTGPNQTEINVYVRLGGYSAVATGEAWFDDISVEQADEIPEGHAEQLLYFESAPVQEDEFAIDAQPSAARWVVTAIVFALFAALMVVLSARSVRGQRSLDEEIFPQRMWLVLGAALIARIVLALGMRGFETDINCFLSWSSRAFETGPLGFYGADVFCDYPPGYIYVLWLCGALRALLGQTGGGMLAVLIVKLPNILADLVACRMLIGVLQKRFSLRTACALSLLYALNPAVILDSAGWGQADGLLSLAIVIPLCFAAQKKWRSCLVTYAVAVLLKPQALLFAPLGVLVLGAEIVRSKNKAQDIRKILAGLGMAVAIWIGLSMPFAAKQVSVSFPDAPGAAQPVIWLFEKYFGTLGSYSYYTVSACNFWDLIGLNWVEIEGGAAQIAGWAAYAAAFGWAIFVYWKSEKRARIFLIGAAMLSVMFAFGLKMHERYLFPAILLLCFAYNEDQDVRIPIALVLISCAQFVNMGLVLDYDWTTMAPRWLVVGTDITVLLSCALLVWTSADICLRGKIYGITRIYRPSAKRLKMQEDEARRAAGSGLFDVPSYKMRLTKKEKIVILAVTALYSAFTFVNLGTLSAPQTSWQSAAPGETVTFDLGSEQQFILTYYGGICDSSFTVEFSSDGESFTEPALAEYNQGQIFRWLWFRPMQRDGSGSLKAIDPDYSYNTARYVRITAEEKGLILSEVGFLSPEDEPIGVQAVRGKCEGDVLALIDEQETVPEYPSYYNSSYFDEIYHVRTAYEHIHGLHTYEWTHPPLGKLLIAVGILIFDMCPFGWRFMGALSGVVMVPVMYLLVRQISKSKLAAFFAMMLMALDCMHFTQSRLGTIDCFAVMFIMLMYLFMFRYARMSFYHEPLRKTFVPLGLSGLFFALGCATKWICIYAGAGLAVLYFYTLVRRYLEYRHASAGLRAFSPEEKKIAQRAARNFWYNAGASCLFCVGFFIALPLLVYYFSYYWQLTPDGNFNVKAVVELQKTIFNYHGGLGDDDHYFRSPWYEWPLIVKPMWYFSGTDFMPAGVISSISCMGNPAVWWGGLAGLVYALAQCVRTKGKERRYLFLLIGFASQYLPWVLVPRSTFIYHYFASVPFIIACAAVLIADIERKNKTLAKKTALVWIFAAAILCAAFYPLMSGTPTPRAYANYLRWFNWYNF